MDPICSTRNAIRSRRPGRDVSSIPESNVTWEVPRPQGDVTISPLDWTEVNITDRAWGLVMTSRRDWLRSSTLGAAGILLSRRIASAEPLPAIAVYKDPGCECCVRWVKHLSANGFVTTVRDSTDMPSVKRTIEEAKPYFQFFPLNQKMQARFS